MASPAYRSRKPKASPLWQCLFRHFDAFLGQYEKCYRNTYGFLRPAIAEVVNKFLDCGDLEHGFARIRCDHCKKDHLLAFSCKGRWFCPSCHQKKVQLFGVLLAESVLYPVPHRHYTLGIPKMLRPYFRYNRDLLKELCRIARDCVVDYQRTALHLPDGLFGAVRWSIKSISRIAWVSLIEPYMLPLANAPPKRPRFSTVCYARSVKPDRVSRLHPPDCGLGKRILRHLGLWEEGIRLNLARAPPDGEGSVELFPGDPLPDYPVTT